MHDDWSVYFFLRSQIVIRRLLNKQRLGAEGVSWLHEMHI